MVLQAEKVLLEEKGHTVDLLENNNDDIVNSWEKTKAAVNSIYSFSSKQRVYKEITRSQPDVVHIHNFFPRFSPSIYYACQEAKVPVVQTLHNYRLFCSNGYLFREGKVCEDCLGKLFPLPGVVHGCYRDSKIGSATVATMLFVHRVLQTFQEQVDVFIALTEFAKQKYIEGGLPADKIVVKPNFVSPIPTVGKGQGNFVLFVGRLSEEKGLRTLLKAWQNIGMRMPLKIVGDGFLHEYVKAEQINIPGVEYLGFKPIEEVYDLMGEASALIFPSQWYEGLPRNIIESFAKGTPVIASKLGAMATLIEHQRTGLHFEPGSSEGLVQQVEWMLSHPAQWKVMRQQVRTEFETKYTVEKNYELLMSIYRLAIEKYKE